MSTQTALVSTIGLLIVAAMVAPGYSAVLQLLGEVQFDQECMELNLQEMVQYIDLNEYLILNSSLTIECC